MTQSKTGWGPWQYDTKDNTLVFEPGGMFSYYIPMRECVTSAATLDWLMQVAQKTWADDQVLAGLCRAMNDILQPQATMCSGGVERARTLSKSMIRGL